MTLRITILPASTQAGKETIKALLKENREIHIKGVYRTPAKAPQEFTSCSNFKAVKGDLSGGLELDLSNSDAVFYIPPPTYDGTHSAEFATRGANKVRVALQKAPEVRRLLIFSALGAEHDQNIGILKINHIADEILNDSVAEVVIAKTGWFMENWASAFDTINSDKPSFESFITPVSLLDVGEICAQKLLATGQRLPSSPHVLELHGPQSYSSLDVKDALERVTGKRVSLVAVEPSQLYDFYSDKVPPQYVQELVDMNLAMLPGGAIAGNLGKEEIIVRGTTSLFESLRKIACGETMKAASGAF